MARDANAPNTVARAGDRTQSGDQLPGQTAGTVCGQRHIGAGADKPARPRHRRVKSDRNDLAFFLRFVVTPTRAANHAAVAQPHHVREALVAVNVGVPAASNHYGE
jgi:hypothetical protein